jgi:hypothetical protein
MIPWSTVSALYTEYQTGISLAELSRRSGRCRASLRELFATRGLPLREVSASNRHSLGNPGRFLAAEPVSQARVEELIATATKLAIPEELRLDWRKWSLERRADFVRRIRARLQDPDEAPTGPYSSGLTFFDYGSAEAHAIADKQNEGRNSRTKVICIKLGSHGVIYEGELWFWCSKVGYQQGLWTPGHGRPVLHHHIWAQTNQRPVPDQHIVRFIDGNKNNHAPDNLQILHRGEICYENLNRSRTLKSRSKLNTILKLNHQPETTHDSLLRRRKTR